jgi:hypothetical protein
LDIGSHRVPIGWNMRLLEIVIRGLAFLLAEPLGIISGIKVKMKPLHRTAPELKPISA